MPGSRALPIFPTAKLLVTQINSEMFGGSTLCKITNTSRTTMLIFARTRIMRKPPITYIFREMKPRDLDEYVHDVE